MKTINKAPAQKQQKPQTKTSKVRVKDTDADGSSPYVDLDKADFSERDHGRTHKSSGSGHEPGTVPGAGV